MKKTICAAAVLLALLAGCAVQTPQPEQPEAAASAEPETQAPVEL